MASSTANPVFEKALEDFKSGLKKKDRDQFGMATLPDLLKKVEDLQKAQHAKRRGQNLALLKPFIEAMEQFGKIVEIFTNASQFVAYVWGPLKLLLQIASSYADAFTGLLDVYHSIGERIPLLLQYEGLFRADVNMSRVLTYLYTDILEFHRRALKYFQQPMLRQLFQATWKTYKTSFEPLVSKMDGHIELIQKQAGLSQIQAFRQAQQRQEARDKAELEHWEQRKFRELCAWLSAPTVDNDQRHHSEIREECPGSGKWLLSNAVFKEWFDAKFPPIPALLWMNGIPGAGKTVLASLVVDEAKKLGTHPAVLFFYCKGDDKDRNNFASIARTFLSQLLGYNRGILLPYYYETFSKSTEAVLDNRSTLEELLQVTIQNCQSVYIVIDGIDECERDERRRISQWFRKLVENLPASNPDSVRCLFVSQDDGIARKDFAGITPLRIKSSDNQSDIKEYSSSWAAKIQSKFGEAYISEDCRKEIASKIPEAANGMFLLAKLIAKNLYGQVCSSGVKTELDEANFPKELSKAYSRIISRIFDTASPSELAATKLLLRWLVCAKRPLKWHEIQAAKSIDLKNQLVNLQGLSFRIDSKDLCGSLVEIRDDGTVELVHLTAKFFLTSEKHVDQPLGEIQLAHLCINYLNLPGFREGCSSEEVTSLVSRGDYAFVDYAFPYWIRHLEDGSSYWVDDLEDSPRSSRERNDLFRDFSESLETFLEIHSCPSFTRTLTVSKGNVERLQAFRTLPFYERLRQSVISARKELTFCGDMKVNETALNLTTVVRDIRAVIEQVYTQASGEPRERCRIEGIYGTKLFKCTRPSCQDFSDGFTLAEKRDQHLYKHNRPFRCSRVGCPFMINGMATEKALEKHEREVHNLHQDKEIEAQFPSDLEVLESQRPVEAPVSPPPAPPVTRRDPEPTQQILEPTQPTQPSSEQAPISARSNKRRIIQEFRCPHCEKTFNRRYNLASHLITHGNSRDFVCETCGLGFARESDRKRHVNTTHADKSFVCGGTLNDGRTWGCGARFSRADTLRSHYKSQLGRNCILSRKEPGEGEPQGDRLAAGQNLALELDN